MLYFEAASWSELEELTHPSSAYSDSITIKLTSDIDCNDSKFCFVLSGKLFI